MSKTLSFSKDRVRVLVSTELDSVFGGQAAEPTASAVSSAAPAANPTATAVSSAFNGGTPQPTSSAIHGGGAANPTATAVSSARPVHHRKHHSPVSSAIPSSAIGG
jgi:hypothetical protein